MPFSPKLVRIVRHLLISVAVFATVLAFIVVIENWRGDRAWAKYAATQTAKGIDLTALPKPSTLRDDVNFLKTPVIDRWLFVQSNDKELTAFFATVQDPFERTASAGRSFGFVYGERFDHAKLIGFWNEYRKKRRETEIALTANPASQTLQLLAPMDAVLAELRQAAASRKETQLVRPVPINQMHPFDAPIPGFRFLRELGGSLSLHACASLSTGQVDLAHDDVLAGLKLARGMTNAPDTLLVEAMIGTVLTRSPLQAIWEGQQRHSWRSEQLVEFQQELAMADLFKSLDRSFHTERAGFVNAVDHVSLDRLFQLTETNKCLGLIPRGWIQQNKIVACDMAGQRIDLLATRNSGKFLPALAKIDQVPDGFYNPIRPYMFIASISGTAVRKITGNVAHNQALITLAQTACALERYWLVNGNYPGSLAELMPAYLAEAPTDIVNGQPLQYRRTDNGKFILYSLGLDGKDDGGKTIGPGNTTDSGGDWAWPQLIEG